MISASFDDAGVHDVRIAELMEKYKIPTIFYWPVFDSDNFNKGRDSLSQSERKTIASKFEIGSHTLTHKLLTKVSKEEAWEEINESRNILQKAFDQPINSFCYPRGYANDEIRFMVHRAGYTSARNTLIGSITPPTDPLWISTTVHVGYDRAEYGTDWLTYARQTLAIARETKDSVYHFWGHAEELNRLKQWDRFETFLKEL